VIEERPAVFDHAEEDEIHGLLSQRRIVMEVADARDSGSSRNRAIGWSPGGRSFSRPIHELGQPPRSRQ